MEDGLLLLKFSLGILILIISIFVAFVECRLFHLVAYLKRISAHMNSLQFSFRLTYLEDFILKILGN